MRVLLVGTGTDVGKTHVTCALGAFARAERVRVTAYKPVATGVVAEAEDAALHARATGRPYVAPTFAYRRPVSPHLAAREEHRPVELDPIVARAADLARDADLLLIETAGGLFSPIDDRRTVADLARALAPDAIVLVAADRLGVLHDVRSTRLAAEAAGLPRMRVVVSAPPVPDDSTGGNAGELDRLGLGPVAAVFPRAPFDAPASLAAASSLWASLRADARAEASRAGR
jgi:dethiobiotin synthetase